VPIQKKLGLNVSTVVAWERGRVRKLFPKVRQLRRLLKAYSGTAPGVKSWSFFLTFEVSA
jgi:transcriptional regulator with XRE-family HTH domain